MELTIRHINKQENKISKEKKFINSWCILIWVINTECFSEGHGKLHINNITKECKLETSM